MTSRTGVVLRNLTVFPDVSEDSRGLSKISSYAGGPTKMKYIKGGKKKTFIPNLCKILVFKAWQRNDAYSKDRWDVGFIHPYSYSIYFSLNLLNLLYKHQHYY